PGTSHTFVSFNYDLVLDRGIQRALGEAMDLARGYGFEISLQVTGDPPENNAGPFAAPPATPLPRVGGTDVQVFILKSHGSLNWLVPTRGASESLTEGSPLRDGKSAILPLTPAGSLRYFPSTATFQRMQAPNELPVDYEPVIL